jgi:hypothetical protein
MAAQDYVQIRQAIRQLTDPDHRYEAERFLLDGRGRIRLGSDASRERGARQICALLRFGADMATHAPSRLCGAWLLRD